MKNINFLSLMITVLVGFFLAGPVGAVVTTGISLIPKNVTGLKADLLPEVWTGEIVKGFRHDDAATFLSRIPDYSQYADNDVIHLVDVGADPDVLINNTTYPIEVQSLDDTDIPIGLDKFQTKATKITDDELYKINYAKMQSVIERHKSVITETKHDKAIHAMAPAADAAKTPVVGTSGSDIAAEGRKAITIADILAMKKKFDTMKVPMNGRILVLCPDHANDLLSLDQTFKDKYYAYTTGKIANMYGFEVYEYVGNPHFDGSTLGKKAFGAALTPGTDFMASVAFYAPRMFKATGSTKTYLSEAKNNPTTQENLINFRHYFIALPKKAEAYGAIASTKTV